MAQAFEALLAMLLERIETEGTGAIDAFCAEHRDDAAALRQRVNELERLGLLPRPAESAAGSDKSVGKHRLLRLLGAGGMGVVHLALDTALGRRVALKTLPAHAHVSAGARERFGREARAVARLHHPNMVPIFEIGEHEGAPYFTMEYVEGCTIADALAALRRAGAHPSALTPHDLLRAADIGTTASGATLAAAGAAVDYPTAAAHLALAVADALAFVHAEGVLHRDVKPSNIMLGRDGSVRLFDFGLAHCADSAPLTLTGEFLGTPHYVSPEQARGRAVDARTDVYGLGVTLYELLTLQPPFRGGSPQDVLRAVIERDPTRPQALNAGIPRDLASICERAIEKEPARRYAGAAGFAADLRRFLAGAPVHARPLRAVTRAWRRMHRNPALTAAIAFGTLLLLGTPIGLLVANVNIRAQADAAEASRRDAGTLALVLEQVFLDADFEELGPAASAADLLKAAAGRVRTQLADLPAERARLLMKLGSVLGGLSEVQDARSLLADALAAQEARLGVDHPDLAETINHLANVEQLGGELARAEQLYVRARQILTGAAQADSALGRTVAANLAILMLRTSRAQEALPLLEDLLAALARQPVPQPDQVVQTLVSASRAQRLLRRPAEAAAFLQRARDLATAGGVGERSMELVLGAEAQLAMDRDDLPRARALRADLVALAQKVHGERTVNAAWALYELAELDLRLGATEAAERGGVTALAIYRERFGADAVHPELGPPLLGLAAAARARGDAAAAEQRLRESLPMFASSSAFAWLHGRAHLRLAEVLAARGETAAARESLARADALFAGFRGVADEHEDLVAARRLRDRIGR